MEYIVFLMRRADVACIYPINDYIRTVWKPNEYYPRVCVEHPENVRCAYKVRGVDKEGQIVW